MVESAPSPVDVGELAGQGLTDREIAARLGRSVSAVVRVRRRYGITAGARQAMAPLDVGAASPPAPRSSVDWGKAACAGVLDAIRAGAPDPFFTTTRVGDGWSAARGMCESCLLLDECRVRTLAEDARVPNEPEGFRAGMTPTQRRRARAGAVRMAELARKGTEMSRAGSAWPPITVELDETGKGLVVVAGVRTPVTASDLDAGRRFALDVVASTAARLGREVEAAVTDPSGSFAIVVSPDGAVSQAPATRRRGGRRPAAAAGAAARPAEVRAVDVDDVDETESAEAADDVVEEPAAAGFEVDAADASASPAAAEVDGQVVETAYVDVDVDAGETEDVEVDREATGTPSAGAAADDPAPEVLVEDAAAGRGLPQEPAPDDVGEILAELEETSVDDVESEPDPPPHTPADVIDVDDVDDGLVVGEPPAVVAPEDLVVDAGYLGVTALPDTVDAAVGGGDLALVVSGAPAVDERLGQWAAALTAAHPGVRDEDLVQVLADALVSADPELALSGPTAVADGPSAPARVAEVQPAASSLPPAVLGSPAPAVGPPPWVMSRALADPIDPRTFDAGDLGPADEAAGDAGDRPSRRGRQRWLVAAVWAVCAAVLVGGVLTGWQLWRAHQQDVAEAQVVAAEQVVRAEHTALGAAIDAGEQVLAHSADQVDDVAAREALADVLERARQLQGQVVVPTPGSEADDLRAAAAQYEAMAGQIETAAQAVTDSMGAFRLARAVAAESSAREALVAAIAAGEQVLADSDGRVLDNGVREHLRAVLDAAATARKAEVDARDVAALTAAAGMLGEHKAQVAAATSAVADAQNVWQTEQDSKAPAPDSATSTPSDSSTSSPSRGGGTPAAPMQPDPAPAPEPQPEPAPPADPAPVVDPAPVGPSTGSVTVTGSFSSCSGPVTVVLAGQSRTTNVTGSGVFSASFSGVPLGTHPFTATCDGLTASNQVVVR